MKYAFLDKQDNLLAYGEKIEAAQKAFNFSLDGSILTAKPKGFSKVTFHNYTKDFSKEEMTNDCVSFLITKAKDLWGITVLKQEN
jgi:hypothetical protein